MSLVACIAEMAEQLPFSYLCKAVVEKEKRKEKEKKYGERAQSGEDRIMKI